MPKDKEKFKMAMEEARRDLQHRLEELLGKEHALTLMAALPPTEPATKADVDGLGTALREEMRSAFKNVRAEMRAMEARLNERIDLKVEASEHRMIAALHQELGDLRKEMVTQTRAFVFTSLTAVIATGGLAFTATRLG